MTKYWQTFSFGAIIPICPKVKGQGHYRTKYGNGKGHGYGHGYNDTDDYQLSIGHPT